MKAQVWRDIGWTFLITMGILVILYPDQFIHCSRRFMMSHDTELHEENLFTLVSYFFQGGVQLYDRFDGISNIYNMMTAGLYSVLDMLLAGIYLVISPFCDHSGQLLHNVYSIGFYTGGAILRLLGGYLLLGKFTRNRAAIMIALVYFNVFLVSQVMNRGMHTNNLYSYLPLLFYFILNFFESFKLKELCLAALVLVIAIANAPFFALSYFYILVHFFVISCLIVCCVYSLRPVKGCVTAAIKGWRQPREWKYAMGIVAAIVLLLLPYALMNHSFKTDFFIANSGLNGTQGRLQGMGISDYFAFPGRSYAHPLEFLIKAFDFSETRWGSTWMFLGFSTFFLIVCGLILSRQRLKWTIVLLAIFLFSLNIPANPKDPFAFAHWLNVLTNPFHFLDRSFHMSALLWYFSLPPLIALGVESLLALVQKRDEVIHANRVSIVLGFFLGLTGLFLYMGPPLVHAYVLTQSLIVIIFITIFRSRHVLRTPWLAIFLAVFCIGIDLCALKHYVDWDLDSQVHLKAQSYRALMTQTPQVVDYQNPKIFPQRMFYKVDPDQVEPPIQTYQNAFGAFYSHMPLPQRFVRPAYLYEPRPMIFKDLYNDRANAAYLQKDGRVIFFAPYAMDEVKVFMGTLLANNMDRQVVLLDGRTPNLTAPSAIITPLPLPEAVTKNFVLDLNKARSFKRGALVELMIDLPRDFPAYVSTSIFTQDYFALELSVDNIKCAPVQGYLSQAFSFDVQNVKEGKAAVLLPASFDPKSKQVQLTLRQFNDITGVWRNTHDSWGFNYKAPVNGWLVFHYPYDPKWSIMVDGKKEILHKANGYYLAVHLNAGEHRILLEFWPGSILRPLLLISALLSIAVVFFVFWEGYRREA